MKKRLLIVGLLMLTLAGTAVAGSRPSTRRSGNGGWEAVEAAPSTRRSGNGGWEAVEAAPSTRRSGNGGW